MQELLMLPRRCAELGASWCPGLRTVYVVAQAIVWKSPRCRGQLLSWSRVFLLVPSLWGSAHACGCEYTARVLFLIQNDDLELVGLCFIGNVEWGLLKPILKHPKLLSSALIWRNNKFFKTKWQCSFFFFFATRWLHQDTTIFSCVATSIHCVNSFSFCTSLHLLDFPDLCALTETIGTEACSAVVHA